MFIKQLMGLPPPPPPPANTKSWRFSQTLLSFQLVAKTWNKRGQRSRGNGTSWSREWYQLVKGMVLAGHEGIWYWLVTGFLILLTCGLQQARNVVSLGSTAAHRFSADFCDL